MCDDSINWVLQTICRVASDLRRLPNPSCLLAGASGRSVAVGVDAVTRPIKNTMSPGRASTCRRIVQLKPRVASTGKGFGRTDPARPAGNKRVVRDTRGNPRILGGGPAPGPAVSEVTAGEKGVRTGQPVVPLVTRPVAMKCPTRDAEFPIEGSSCPSNFRCRVFRRQQIFTVSGLARTLTNSTRKESQRSYCDASPS